MLFADDEIVRIKQVKESVKFKVKETLNNLLAPYIFEKEKVFISGGCIASLLQGDEPKDWDFYFKDETTMNTVKNICEKNPLFVMDISEKYREVIGRNGKLITENAVTLTNNVQFILKHYGTPQEVRNTFDFVHCMPYYDVETDQLFISKMQYDACVSKTLCINNRNSVTPARIHKFEERGYQKDW